MYQFYRRIYLYMPKFKITRVKSMTETSVIEGATLFEALSTELSNKESMKNFDCEKGMALNELMSDDAVNGLMTMKQAQSLLTSDGFIPSVVKIEVEGDRPTTA